MKGCTSFAECLGQVTPAADYTSGLGPCLAATWGWHVVTLFAAFSCYLGVGYAHAAKTKGVRGMSAVPHAYFWREIHGLVEDGVRYSKQARLGTRRTGREDYSRLGAVKPGAEEHRVKRQKKGKKEKKVADKDSCQSDGDTEVSKRGGTGAVPPVSADSPDTALARSVAAAGTAAGDGGRWVHVPN